MLSEQTKHCLLFLASQSTPPPCIFLDLKCAVPSSVPGKDLCSAALLKAAIPPGLLYQENMKKKTCYRFNVPETCSDRFYRHLICSLFLKG